MTTNLTSTFTPTFLQKLLGRGYKWWYIIYYNFKLHTQYLINEIFASTFRISGLLTSLVIFTFLQKEDPTIITYLVVGTAYFSTTGAQVSWFVGNSIQNGKISRILLLPTNFFSFIFFTGFSTALFLLMTYSVILIPLFIIFFNSLIFSWNIGYLLMLFLIVVTIRVFIELLVGLTAFWTTEFYGAAYLNTGMLAFFSGSVFPLNFISDKLWILNYSPYSILFYHPMQIYLGKYSPTEILYVFLGGITWCVVLYFLAKWVFKLGLKRNESVGL